MPLYCEACGVEQDDAERSNPLQCPSCGNRQQFTTRRPWKLNHNDRRFLKSLRIKAEPPRAGKGES